MATKLNCWTVMQCGREPGGAKAVALGVCPAATERAGEAINGGVRSGRICWAIAGTFCGGVQAGTRASKQPSCMLCPFFRQVKTEEGATFIILPPDQEYVPRPHLRN